MNAWGGAALGGALGLVFAGIIVTVALNLPETYRRNSGYKKVSEMDAENRRRVIVACCLFGAFVAAGAAGLGAWALPAFQ